MRACPGMAWSRRCRAGSLRVEPGQGVEPGWLLACTQQTSVCITQIRCEFALYSAPPASPRRPPPPPPPPASSASRGMPRGGCIRSWRRRRESKKLNFEGGASRRLN